MHTSTRLATALTLLTVLGVATAASASTAPQMQDTGVRALDGDWIYVEDRTEGRATERHQPSMSSRVRLRVEDDALVLIRSDGEIRMPLDGSPTEVHFESWVSRYRGAWKDGAFVYQSESVPEPGDTSASGIIQWELRVTQEGLMARVAVDPPTGFTSVALYRHPEDIALPAPATATIGDLAWLGGNWVGTRGTSGTISIEERWGPPLGGAMLGVARTVSRERMTAFEFLRIVERDSGLVYIAQPDGGRQTEFVLTELNGARAEFENPRHSSPQRIVYERSTDGRLSATIGFINGGRPQRFEFMREGS